MPTSKQWAQHKARWAKFKAAGGAQLTPEQRRAIIEAPFPAVRVLGHSSAWGGVYVRDTIPTDGRRVWKNTPEDEEWLKNRWEEK